MSTSLTHPRSSSSTPRFAAAGVGDAAVSPLAASQSASNQSAANFPSSASPRRNFRSSRKPQSESSAKPPVEHEILFQNWFKSVGPRTYAVQLKKAGNGNHFLVFTEGHRDDKTGVVRKTRLFVFSEDFTSFFKMLHDTAVFVRQHPLPPEVKQKRDRYWARKAREEKVDEPSRPRPGKEGGQSK